MSLWNLQLRDARVSLMEGELQRTLGRNLRAYRKAHDLSQETFAEIMGVPLDEMNMKLCHEPV